VVRGRITIITAVVLLLAAAGPAQPASARHSGHSERLAARARRGDRVARTTLVEEHMGLVRSVAFRYRDLGVPMDDLVQEGAIGLLTAVDQYDPSFGTRFSTYAFWRIRAAVTHAVTAQATVVRIPRPLLERRREVATTRHRLTREREPSIAEIAAATKLSPGEVVEALTPTAVVSLDESERAAVGGVAADASHAPDAQVIHREQTRELSGGLRHLTPRKREILKRHYGLVGPPATLNEISGDLRLSPERTRTLKDEALRELAAALPAPAP
jgi:RNA polymerase sigma factor (sigma-70 family)